MADRTCGDCSACCATLAVTELSKPAWTRCEHQCAGGCGIYPQRPAICTQYACMWLQGHLPEACRPDQFGLILTLRRDEGELWVEIHEAWEGSVVAALPLLSEVGNAIRALLPTAELVFVPWGETNGTTFRWRGPEQI